jgi:hypothetical protein
MKSFAYGDTKEGDKFYTNVEYIYNEFAKLERHKIAQFKRWYQANNNIGNVCANDCTDHLIRYSDIETIFPDLCNRIESFFKGLYSPGLLKLSILQEKIGHIDDHYDNFMQTNSIGRCPFCGINRLKGAYHSKREAYDHYLPKALYPFNSINFYNLVPACHDCNSNYKLSKDPAYTPKDPVRKSERRKIFYPFSKAKYSIELEIRLAKDDIENLTPVDINISYGPPELNTEIETWRFVYGIDERYKATCLNESEGKYWLEQVIDEWQEEGRSPEEYLKALRRNASRKPFADSNFLKKAFLEGCERAGLFKEKEKCKPVLE